MIDAEVRFIVAWKSQDDTEETAIILPDIKFRKDEGMNKVGVI